MLLCELDLLALEMFIEWVYIFSHLKIATIFKVLCDLILLLHH